MGEIGSKRLRVVVRREKKRNELILNDYSFTRNSPLIRFDPFGLEDKCCWKAEGFSNEQDYKNALDFLNSINPGFPGPIDALCGYKVGSDAKKKYGKSTNDKWLHCYIGCMIANKCNQDTALYAAWWKEYQDLADCKSNTHYDPSDFDATELGASYTGNEQDCYDSCASAYGSPSEPPPGDELP